MSFIYFKHCLLCIVFESRRRKQCGHKGATSINLRGPRIITYLAVTASEISSPVKMPINDISSTPYENQLRSKGQSNWSSLNEQSTLERREYGNNVHGHTQGVYDEFGFI